MRSNAASVTHLPRWRLIACAALGLLSVAVSSCSHKPSVSPKIPPSITRTPVRVPAPINARPKHLPPIAFPDLDTGQIDGVTFSPDGRLLAFGYGADSAITVLDLTTGRLAWQRHIDSADSGPILFTPDGRTMIVSCYDPDNDEPLWICTAGGRLLRKLPGADDFWLAHRGRFLVTADLPFWNWSDTAKSQQPHLSVWDTQTWRRTVDHYGKTNENLSLTASGRIVRLPVHPEFSSLRPPNAPPNDAWWRRVPPLPYEGWATVTARSGRYFVRGGGDHNRRGVIECWDLHHRTRLWSENVIDGSPRSVALSPDGRQVAVGTMQGSVDFRESRSGHLLRCLSGLGDAVRCVRFSPNGRVLVAAGGAYSTKLRLFNTTTYGQIADCRVAFTGEEPYGHNWSLIHPDWFTVLPDLAYIASPSVVRKIRTPGRKRDAVQIARFDRPRRVREALRLCYIR